jgi:hypothetical protein
MSPFIMKQRHSPTGTSLSTLSVAEEVLRFGALFQHSDGANVLSFGRF